MRLVPRPIWLVLTCLFLTGCGSTGTSEYGQLFEVIKNSFGDGAFGTSNVSLKTAAAIPYASMGWRLNNGNQQIIVLATDTNGRQLWTSSAHIVFQTQDGRIIQTVGMRHNIAALTSRSGQKLPPPAAALNGAFTDQRMADFPDAGVYNLALNCRTQAKQAPPIRILGKSLRTRRVDETCESANPRWTFTNSYWIDSESAFVWRSAQHIHLAGDIVQTEIFRPPG